MPASNREAACPIVSKPFRLLLLSMGQSVAKGRNKVLSKSDEHSAMSDTTFAQYAIKEAFPPVRHGSVKAAQSAAYSFLRKRVMKELTIRRIRSIWEGKARRIDGEEKDALRLAQIEEARNEYVALRSRLASLTSALAVADPAFFGPEVDAYRELAGGLGRSHRAGTEE